MVANLNLGAFQTPAEIYVGILAATILFLATNAGLIGVSRLVYSMGIHRQLPDRLRQLHPKYRTPWVGILLFGFLAMLITLPGEAAFLGNLYAFGAMLSFTIAHSAIIRLRISRPDLHRPYRAPGNWNFRGHDLPVFAFLGGFGTFAALVVTIALHPDVAITGVVWLTLGVFVFMFYRRAQGLDLTSTHKVAIPQPVVDHEAEYDSVLVPLSEGYNETVIATAAKLAARRRRGIHVLAIVTVPSALKIDAAMPEAVAAAETADRAGAAAGGRARVRARRAGAVRPGRAAHHRGGDGHARGGDRDAAAAPHQRRLDLRQDVGDGAGRAAVPGDHRVHAGGPPASGADPVKLLRGYILPALMVLIGVGLIVRTIFGGGGPVAIGIILGVLFVAAGVGRIYVERSLR